MPTAVIVYVCGHRREFPVTLGALSGVHFRNVGCPRCRPRGMPAHRRPTTDRVVVRARCDNAQPVTGELLLGLLSAMPKNFFRPGEQYRITIEREP